MAILRDIDYTAAADIVETLMLNGINSLEVSLSNEEKGLQTLIKLHEEYGRHIRIGAGTVTSKKQINLLSDLKIPFIITPGWDKELVQYALDNKSQVIPGVYSPGEIMQALSLGIEEIKLFPIEDFPVTYIKNLFGPFPHMNIVGVGGISTENIQSYFDAGVHAFAIGSDLVPRGATNSKESLNNISLQAKKYSQILKVV